MPFTGSNTSNIYKEYLTDINGDGLNDYIFAERQWQITYGMQSGGSCVYLNNGSGFDVVYKCYASYDGTQQFYGDCAG